tara:strand:+ start:260 stop:427 length:168 start_codon:yes stop_codon:yes gene_type:complete
MVELKNNARETIFTGKAFRSTRGKAMQVTPITAGGVLHRDPVVVKVIAWPEIVMS